MTFAIYQNSRTKDTWALALIIASLFTVTSCNRSASMKPDFNTALQQHLASISNRDIEAFKSHLTRGDTLYTVVQNGHAFTTPSETIAIHEQRFKDPNWIWEGSVVHKVVGEDVAMALVKYQYRARTDDAPISSWLTFVFQLQEGQWRIVHDQNTALDYAAFARAAGIDG
jgi:hypothetical protein